MKKTVVLLILLTIISKVLGLGREIVLSYFYGASDISDAYLISYTIPGTLFAFIAVGISTGFIPMYSKIKVNQGNRLADIFTNNVITLSLIISTLFSLVVFLFPTTIVKLFASGFEGETLRIATNFTRVTILGTYFIGLTYIHSSYLRAHNKFIAPALVGIPFNLTIIIFIAVSSSISNVYLLPMGLLLAMFFQQILLTPFVFKTGQRYKPLLQIKEDNFKEFLYLSVPVIIGVSVNQINTLIDRTLASQLLPGAISALNYSNRLIFFVQGLFIMSITTVLFPVISKMAAEKNITGLKRSVSEAIGIVNLLIIPATIGILIFSKEIVQLVFGRGAFDAQDVYITSSALFFYSIGLIGMGYREIVSNAFYSLQDTKTPMVNSGISMVINIILNIILSRYLGIAGLALATSISTIICSILLFISFKRKIGMLHIKTLFISLGKVLTASIIMGIVVKLIYAFLINNYNTTFTLMLAIIIAVLTYLILIYTFKVKEVDSLIKQIQRRFSNSK